MTVAPIGFIYEEGAQGWACEGGELINSKSIHNLNFEVLDGDGVTVLAHGSSSAAGLNEQLSAIALGQPGVKYIRVFPVTNTNDVQLYSLSVTVEPLSSSGAVTLAPGHGRAGTVFAAELSGFMPNSEVTLWINGAHFMGTVTTEADGRATFWVDSTSASEGWYFLRAVSGGREVSARIVVESGTPLVVSVPGDAFSLAEYTAYTHAAYLPFAYAGN